MYAKQLFTVSALTAVAFAAPHAVDDCGPNPTPSTSPSSSWGAPSSSWGAPSPSSTASWSSTPSVAPTSTVATSSSSTASIVIPPFSSPPPDSRVLPSSTATAPTGIWSPPANLPTSGSQKASCNVGQAVSCCSSANPGKDGNVYTSSTSCSVANDSALCQNTQYTACCQADQNQNGILNIAGGNFCPIIAIPINIDALNGNTVNLDLPGIGKN